MEGGTLVAGFFPLK